MMQILLSLETIRAIHDDVLDEKNLTGERGDRVPAIYGRMSSRLIYMPVNDVFDVAGITCVYIANGHGFVGGNKRTAFACSMTILALAGIKLNFDNRPDADALFGMIIAAGAGHIDETHIANYLRGRYMEQNGLFINGSFTEDGQRR